jgi:hypothetical protein
VGIWNRLLQSPYRTINLVLLGFIFCIFVYSAIFSPDRGNYLIQSNQKFFSNKKTLSTGLSRGFSSIIRLQFTKAQQYNSNSFRIFIFFLVQGIMRFLFILVWESSSMFYKQRIIVTDAVISTVMFIVFFWPFLEEMFVLK